MEFFDKRPGDKVLTKVLEDGTVMAILGDVVPDVVRLPSELGGHVVKVLSHITASCIAKDCDQHHHHYRLDHDVGIGKINVCGCPKHGFLWYKGG